MGSTHMAPMELVSNFHVAQWSLPGGAFLCQASQGDREQVKAAVIFFLP